MIPPADDGAAPKTWREIADSALPHLRTLSDYLDSRCDGNESCTVPHGSFAKIQSCIADLCRALVDAEKNARSLRSPSTETGEDND